MTDTERAAKAIEQFNRDTDGKLPAISDVLALCEGCRITFRMRDGEPRMVASPDIRNVTLLVQELVKSEPWRSQIISTIPQE